MDVRRLLVPMLFAPLIGGCESDPTGIRQSQEELWPYGEYGGGPETRPGLRGSVTVDGEPVLPGEGVAHFYLEDGPVLFSLETVEGGYEVPPVRLGDWACRGEIQIELRNGPTSARVPLLPSLPDPCPPAHVWPAGATVAIEAGPMDSPGVVSGRVLVDDEPASAGMYTVRIGSGPGVELALDEDGRYRWETRDRREWFTACAGVSAWIDGEEPEARATLGIRPNRTCTGPRVMPDIRLGSVRAAELHVLELDGFHMFAVEAGEAVAQLLHPVDLTPVGEAGTSLDDGSIHLWFPADLDAPSCHWILRLTLADGFTMTRPFEARHCSTDLFEEVHVDRSPTPILTLSVEDPVGDHTGRTDVRRMTMWIDPSTGDYLITLVADTANPFRDLLRVNVNLFDPEAGSFFSDTMNDLFLEAPVTEIQLSGTSEALGSWRAGQAVYTNSLDGGPVPPGISLFRTSVTHFPMGFLDNEDVIAPAERWQPVVLRTP